MFARALVTLASLVSSAAAAAPALDAQFASHSVIQRDKPVVLTGTAAPGEQVSISFAGASASASADSTGKWHASFPARAAGGPYAIALRGAGGATAFFDDVMIGDVWLCSGQSNMEYPLRRALNGDGEVQTANDTDLRLFKVPQQVADDPQAQFSNPPQWQVTTPDSAKDFSAACYFMTRELRASEQANRRDRRYLGRHPR